MQALTRTDPKGIHNFAQLPLARYTVVTPGYIEAKGIPLRAGRAVVDADAHDAQPIVVIIFSTNDLRRGCGYAYVRTRAGP